MLRGGTQVHVEPPIGQGHLTCHAEVPFVVYYRPDSSTEKYTFVTHGHQTVRAVNCMKAILTDDCMDIVEGLLEQAYLKNPSLILVTGEEAVAYTAWGSDAPPSRFTYRNSQFDCGDQHLDWKEIERVGYAVVDFRSWLVSFHKPKATDNEGFLESLDQITCLDSSFPLSFSDGMIQTFLQHWRNVKDKLMEKSMYVMITAGCITHTFSLEHRVWSEFITENDDEGESEGSGYVDSDEASADAQQLPLAQLEIEVVQGLEELDVYLMCGKFAEPPLEKGLKEALDELDSRLLYVPQEDVVNSPQISMPATNSASSSADRGALPQTQTMKRDSDILPQGHSTLSHVKSSPPSTAAPRLNSVMSIGTNFARIGSSWNSEDSANVAYPEDSDFIASFKSRTQSHCDTGLAQVNEAEEQSLPPKDVGFGRLAAPGENSPTYACLPLAEESGHLQAIDISRATRSTGTPESNPVVVRATASTSLGTSSIGTDSSGEEIEKFIPTGSSETIAHVRSMVNLATSVPASKPEDQGTPQEVSADYLSAASTKLPSVRDSSGHLASLSKGVSSLPRNSSWPTLKGADELGILTESPSFTFAELLAWSQVREA